LVTQGQDSSTDYASRIIILVLAVIAITLFMILMLFCKKFLKMSSFRRGGSRKGSKGGKKSAKVMPLPSNSSLYPSLDLDVRRDTPKGGVVSSMGLIKEDESESIFDLTKRTSRTPKSRFIPTQNNNINPTLEQIKEDISVFVLN